MFDNCTLLLTYLMFLRLNRVHSSLMRDCLSVISKTRVFFVYSKAKSVLTQTIENSPENAYSVLVKLGGSTGIVLITIF